ncbi:MAG: hypothetical protein ACI8RZ_004576 [Myxococcota bacterium]|jgi:hypothetical protein
MRWLLPSLLLGCSDYSLTGEKDVSEGTTAPDILTDTLAIDLTGHCGEGTAAVTLSNEGTGPLTITGLEITGDGWTLTNLTLPLTVEPGESVAVNLTGGEGAAELVVTSDDPDTPELFITLDADADNPPSLTIDGPASGVVVEELTALLLEATVWDDEDDLESLQVSWSSDVDGAVGDGPVFAGGASALEWLAEQRTGGSHTLTAAVTDSCGQTTTATVPICQQAFTSTASVDLQAWNYEGVARWDSANDWVELTDTASYAVGSAFDVTTETRGTEVTIEFQFWNGGGSGADGFALTALDLDRATGYLGSAGGCLGYGSGSGCDPVRDALPGWTIEFDTYHNSKWDPTTEDHVAFMFDGAVGTLETWAALPDIEDAQWHTVVIEVADPSVTVSIDGVAYIDTELTGHFDFPAHVGFSAATGGLTNNHLIDALTVTDAACPTD